MLHRREIEKNEVILPKAFRTYFGDKKIGIVDIETTGLSPEHSRMILGGLLVPGNEEIVCHEFFCEYNNDRDEKAVIEAFLNELKKLDAIVTYNGEHFDVPFIRKRAEKYGLDAQEGFPFNLDLYRVLRKYSELSKLLPNLRQKTVESYYGLWQTRTDAISGKDSIDLYYAFLSHKDGEGKTAIRETIILHNSDDIRQLYRLVPIIEKVDFHKAVAGLGFCVGGLNVKTVAIEGNKLKVTGIQRNCPVNYKTFADGIGACSLDFRKSDRSFCVEVGLIDVPGKNGLAGSEDVPGLKLLDVAGVRKKGMDFSNLNNLPEYEKDYIIVEKDKKFNYLTVNAFVKSLLTYIDESVHDN